MQLKKSERKQNAIKTEEKIQKPGKTKHLLSSQNLRGGQIEKKASSASTKRSNERSHTKLE